VQVPGGEVLAAGGRTWGVLFEQLYWRLAADQRRAHSADGAQDVAGVRPWGCCARWTGFGPDA
jgi:hypothetical protein